MDIILLIFDVIIAISLWFYSFSGIIAFFVGIILLQIIPYTLFRQYFITKPEDIETSNGLVGTEILLMTVLIILIVTRK
ncbi:hypothetical protein CWATWH0401_3780 [Crocosphaera watsonii WH 0401]|uniref:Uncharacterized protein n=2 Tax=Crocosphaera watsonii TaxID=263511 RepID=T2JE13_CROWT|nr:hypothetical protein CWATWH0401_3780 [Crocosphaera watsonii WH 0401]